METQLPSELWLIIGRAEWRVWRVLQQCSKYLANLMERIDPYKEFTTIKVEMVSVFNDKYIYWNAGDENIKTVYNYSTTILVECYRDGRNYFYDRRNTLLDGRVYELRYLYKKIKRDHTIWQSVRDESIIIRKFTKEEWNVKMAEYKNIC